MVPSAQEGIAAGASVSARALRSRAAIERTLLAVGSHDVAIDLLAGALAGRGLELVSANVGSIGGLTALRERAARLAGSTRSSRATAATTWRPCDATARANGSR